MACLDDNPDVKGRMQILLEQREAQNLVKQSVLRRQHGCHTQCQETVRLLMMGM